MATQKDAYMTLVGPGKKTSVCGRRIGSRDRMSVMAVCETETIADKIVTALHLLQGEELKLEVPAQRTLNDVRELLLKEQSAISLLRADKRTLETQLKEKSNEIGQLRVALERAERDRIFAQKASLEKA